MSISYWQRKLPEIETFWYLATPYSKCTRGLVWAYIEGAKASEVLFMHNIPHVYAIGMCHTPAHLSNLDPRDSPAWQRRLRPIIDCAGGMIIVTMEDWKKSEGIQEEIRIFTEANKPIEYMGWPL